MLHFIQCIFNASLFKVDGGTLHLLSSFSLGAFSIISFLNKYNSVTENIKGKSVLSTHLYFQY